MDAWERKNDPLESWTIVDKKLTGLDVNIYRPRGIDTDYWFYSYDFGIMPRDAYSLETPHLEEAKRRAIIRARDYLVMRAKVAQTWLNEQFPSSNGESEIIHCKGCAKAYWKVFALENRKCPNCAEELP